MTSVCHNCKLPRPQGLTLALRGQSKLLAMGAGAHACSCLFPCDFKHSDKGWHILVKKLMAQLSLIENACTAMAKISACSCLL